MALRLSAEEKENFGCDYSGYIMLIIYSALKSLQVYYPEGSKIKCHFFLKDEKQNI